MRSFSRLLAVLTALFVSSFALTITLPSSGSQIDPTQDLVISWSISYTDPSTLDIKLSNTDSNSESILASGVVTYTSSYTIPAGTIKGSGSGFSIVAVSNGKTLGQVAGLSLGSTGGQTSTVAGVTLTSTQTVMPTAAGATTSAGTDATNDNVPTASIDSVGVTTGLVSGSQVVASITHTGSSFVTSKTSRVSSGSSAATATAGSTNTASGQRRLSSELVLGAAGVLAGVVALLA